MTTSPQITARIEKPLKNDDLYIFIDRENEKLAYAITEEELPIIRDAIDSYLKEQKQ